MKKCCAMVLAAVLCIGLLAGCGDQAKGGAADQVTAASVGFDVEAYQKAKDEAVRLVNDSTAKYNSHPTIFSSSYDFSEHDPKKRNTYVYFSTDKGSVSVVIRNQSLKLTSVDVNSKEKDKAYLEEMFTHWSKVLGIKQPVRLMIWRRSPISTPRLYDQHQIGFRIFQHQSKLAYKDRFKSTPFC
ncbi:MAG: hypothetical protein ACLSAP_10780 [Oscillospiraceae bacterium]